MLKRIISWIKNDRLIKSLDSAGIESTINKNHNIIIKNRANNKSSPIYCGAMNIEDFVKPKIRSSYIKLERKYPKLDIKLLSIPIMINVEGVNINIPRFLPISTFYDKKNFSSEITFWKTEIYRYSKFIIINLENTKYSSTYLDEYVTSHSLRCYDFAQEYKLRSKNRDKSYINRDKSYIIDIKNPYAQSFLNNNPIGKQIKKYDTIEFYIQPHIDLEDKKNVANNATVINNELITRGFVIIDLKEMLNNNRTSEFKTSIKKIFNMAELYSTKQNKRRYELSGKIYNPIYIVACDSPKTISPNTEFYIIKHWPKTNDYSKDEYNSGDKS